MSDGCENNYYVGSDGATYLSAPGDGTDHLHVGGGAGGSGRCGDVSNNALMEERDKLKSRLNSVYGLGSVGVSFAQAAENMKQLSIQIREQVPEGFCIFTGALGMPIFIRETQIIGVSGKSRAGVPVPNFAELQVHGMPGPVPVEMSTYDIFREIERVRSEV